MNYYHYISSKASWDCIQTIFLCVPGKFAGTKEEAEMYARQSGWISTAEKSAAVLIVPLAEEGWDKQDLSWIPEFYDLHKNDFKAPGGVSIPGRDGTLWLWETMIYLVGYEDGADYAANVLTAQPGFFAASLIVNGKLTDMSQADQEAAHWFVRKPKDYTRTNRQISSAVWLAGAIDPETKEYFRITGENDSCKEETFGNTLTQISYCSTHPAQCVRVSESIPSSDTVMDSFFEHTLRWKNGPDGELRNYTGKKDWQNSPLFHHHMVSVNGLYYPFAVYLPQGRTKAECAGLPLVFSIHGRGEPAWVFAEKNGWHKLADETGEFVVVFPDSPYNIWQIDRDREAVKAIMQAIEEEYHTDPSRVYLSGFSNGAIFTDQQASTFPGFFAAASPWNGPGIADCRRMSIDSYVYEDSFRDSGYEMPFWIVVGDSDGKASADRQDELDIVLPVNGCTQESEEILDHTNCYTEENGYTEGERFLTRAYRNQNGSIRAGLTVMKNMPHGAIWDESRAAWAFMKRFRRICGSKTVEEIQED